MPTRTGGSILLQLRLGGFAVLGLRRGGLGSSGSPSSAGFTSTVHWISLKFLWLSYHQWAWLFGGTPARWWDHQASPVRAIDWTDRWAEGLGSRFLVGIRDSCVTCLQRVEWPYSVPSCAWRRWACGVTGESKQQMDGDLCPAGNLSAGWPRHLKRRILVALRSFGSFVLRLGPECLKVHSSVLITRCQVGGCGFTRQRPQKCRSIFVKRKHGVLCKLKANLGPQ